MKRIPLIPTLIVLLASGLMVWLGMWQLDRRMQKQAQLALYQANITKPEMSFPKMGPVPEEAMFRASTGFCVSVKGWRSEAGKANNGQSGYRWIAECGRGAEGPAMLVDMGVSRDPANSPDWKGGAVKGRLTTEPDHASLFSKIRGQAPVLLPMLVSANAPPGFVPSAPPKLEDVPNPHLAYAVQWFIFAALALIIYALALRARLRKTG